MIGNEAGVGNKQKIIYYFKICICMIIFVGIILNLIAFISQTLFINLMTTGDNNKQHFTSIYQIALYAFINLNLL